jgi:hypothetical protein
VGHVLAGGHGSRHHDFRLRMFGAVTLAILVAGCGSSAAPAPAGSTGSLAANAPTVAGAASAEPPSLSASDALRTYGYGPSPNPAVTFQSDVVVVSGGPASILWASADGHTWAIDAAAPGASKLQVGSVLLLTSRAVGRVLDIQDQGGARIVTVGPVQLTELFADANFNLDQPVDLGSMAYQALPQTPGNVTTPSSSASADPAGNLNDNGATPSPGALTMPTVRLISYRNGATTPADPRAAATAKQLPPASEACQEITLAAKWSIKPCVDGSQISIGVDYDPSASNGSGGLKFGGTVIFKAQSPQLHAQVAIQNGKLASPTVVLAGIKGIDVNLGAGTANGTKDDGKFKFEIPIEVETPIPPSPATLGIPLNLVIEFKLLVEVAMSGNNSTLTAGASYNLDGEMGVRDGQVVSPKLTVNKSIMDSIKGITLGPSGVVFAAKIKLHFGVGMEGFIAGPYATTTFSVGVSQGSALGSPIANCQSASIALWVGAGAGVTFDFGEFANVVPKLTKFQTEVEKNWNVYTVSKTVPDTKICQAP